MARVPERIEFFGDVATTMDVARERLSKIETPAAETMPFGVVAETQSKGRGTGGRVWVSPKGNLYFSLCIPQNNPKVLTPELVPVVSLIFGLACRRAVLALLPAAKPSEVCTKWPNDLIYQHKKIGGTLVESEGDFFVVGMGMNVDLAPQVTDAGREATTINKVAADLGIPGTTPQALSQKIWEELFDITSNPNYTRDMVVQEFEKTMDRTLKLHRRQKEGRDPEELTAVRLNAWGHLIVRHEDGREETLCADYLF